MKATALCNRCETPVILDDVESLVSTGYWAYCPEHDEDLYKFECKLEVTE
jgi:hypothetical protein